MGYDSLIMASIWVDRARQVAVGSGVNLSMPIDVAIRRVGVCESPGHKLR